MVDRILDAERSDLFSEEEKAVIAASIELARNVALSDATFERLARHFDERQLFDIVANAAIANFNNRVTRGLGAEVEERE